MHVSAAVRDVTFQHLARAEMARANAAKSQFLSRVSHELRTPLNAILGFGQLLEMDQLGGHQRDGIEHILGAGRHLLSLINEILDISRVESGEIRLSLEPVYVPEVVDEALGMIRPLAERRGIRIVVDRQCSEMHVMADRQRVTQVLLNLLANAVKYNRENGEVRIEFRILDTSRLRLTVHDTGLGITMDDLGRLFEPFQRLDAAQTDVEGTGLGLILTKQLLTAMNGEVGVTSSVGEGSSFWFELPLAVRPVADARPGEVRVGLGLDYNIDVTDGSAATMQRTATVLYVEDNLSNVRLVEQVLARRPMISLMVAMQGHLALDLARAHQPDLILLDLHLPDTSGEQVLRELKRDRRTASIPVVMLSADATPGRLERLVSLHGAADHLTKPFDIPLLLSIVDSLGVIQQGTAVVHMVTSTAAGDRDGGPSNRMVGEPRD